MTRCNPSYFDLELRPNRPLAPRHALWLVAAVGFVFLLMGLRFLFLGAWPILPFMLADVLLLGWALRASWRSGRARERVWLDETGLSLVRVQASGRHQRVNLPPHLARVELEVLGNRQNRLWLTADGRREPVGGFLSPPERADIARVIDDGLARFRRGQD
jgi:uncharacterized membrane protein